MNYINRKYNRLTIISEPYMVKKGSKNMKYVECRCDCGKIIPIRLTVVKNNITKSCGCLQKDKVRIFAKEKFSTHKLTKHPLYTVWRHMKERCYRKKTHNYHRYGGRGIIVCDNWKNDFKKFYDWALENGWKEGLTIERINNDGNYEPENCTFVTPKKQANNRHTNHYLTIFGETKSLKEWSEDNRCIISYSMLQSRILKGWHPEKAITTN